MSKYYQYVKPITDMFADNLFPEPSKGRTKSGKVFDEEKFNKLLPLGVDLFEKMGLDYKEMMAESMLERVEKEKSKLNGLGELSELHEMIAGLDDYCSSCA